MKNKVFSRFYILSVLGILIASSYPLYMGIRVVSDMLRFGTVYAESYPKYIIPYTPISIAMIFGVAIMPVIIRLAKRHSMWVVSVLCIMVFFAAEFLLESLITVTTTVTETVVKTELESWQMFMCYIPPDSVETRTWTQVDVLMGEYSPAFKLHFYLISVVLILALLNSFYGFGQMFQSGNTARKKALILQSVSAVVFLGLCIFACFTAFFRTGTIQVSPISAVLMCLFFVIFGVTAGIFAGSFLLGKRKLLSVFVPFLVSAGITIAMYIGEMILLSGHLYRFGTGFLFGGIPGIVLAPVDLLVILISGMAAAAIMEAANK